MAPRVTARWALDRVPGNRSPRPPAWAVEFGPVGAVARSDSPKRGTTPRPFPGSPTRSRRGAATFPQTQRRPDPPVPRGKVWAFGAIRLAASGTKTLPSNRRSFPSNRRRFSSPHAVCRELSLNRIRRTPCGESLRENAPAAHPVPKTGPSDTAPAQLRQCSGAQKLDYSGMSAPIDAGECHGRLLRPGGVTRRTSASTLATSILGGDFHA